MVKMLQRLIDKADIVSFDIFDTLIYRSTKDPAEVFSIMADQLKVNRKEFRRERIIAEKRARNAKKEGEITLDDIYANLVFDGITEAGDKIDIQRSFEIERAVEYIVCNANPEMFDIFEYCLRKNKKVILISDMYLDKKHLEKILDKCGYKGYYDFFLSSEINKKKASGELFDYVIDHLKAAPDKILHIGDNFKSDYLVPKNKGIKAYLYKTKNKVSSSENYQCPLLYGIIGNNLNKKSFYYEFGYKYLGPAVYGYVNWIINQLKLRNINKIYFFSREGQFIKRAFDCCTKTEEFEERYLYVSRRSLTVPAITTAKTIEDFLAYRPMYNRVSVLNEIKKLGLEVSEFKKFTWFSEEVLNKTFGELNEKEKNKIQSDMFSLSKKQAAKELNLLIEYLKQEKMEGKFAIVDLGWNGSMQRALAQIFEDNNISVEMTGFFLAQRDEYYKNQEFIENYGYLFDYGKVSENENVLLNSGTNILEFLFSADHGSVLGYSKVDNKIEPVLDNYEFEISYPVIKECQDAAIDFICDIKEKWPMELHIDDKTFFEPMYKVFKCPEKDIINKFGDFDISDMNEAGLYLAEKMPLLPLKRFIKGFKDSGWKVAFLKRNTGLCCSFDIYKFLRKRLN